jgi:hypothetical protein
MSWDSGGIRENMNKQKQLVSLLGAGALVVGMLAATAGTALAADNTQFWQGNGVVNGEIKTNDCETDSSAHQLWIWTGTGSNVTISVDGEVVVGVEKGKGTYQFATGWHDIGDLTAGDGGNVFVTYDGAEDTNAVLTLSHGCPGVEATPTAPATPEVTPTFELQTGDITDAPSEPSTDSIGTNGTSAPADGAWLLVVALGVLLASIVVLTPARAKSRR